MCLRNDCKLKCPLFSHGFFVWCINVRRCSNRSKQLLHWNAIWIRSWCCPEVFKTSWTFAIEWSTRSQLGLLVLFEMFWFCWLSLLLVLPFLIPLADPAPRHLWFFSPGSVLYSLEQFSHLNMNWTFGFLEAVDAFDEFERPFVMASAVPAAWHLWFFSPAFVLYSLRQASHLKMDWTFGFVDTVDAFDIVDRLTAATFRIFSPLFWTDTSFLLWPESSLSSCFGFESTSWCSARYDLKNSSNLLHKSLELLCRWCRFFFFFILRSESIFCNFVWVDLDSCWESIDACCHLKRERTENVVIISFWNSNLKIICKSNLKLNKTIKTSLCICHFSFQLSVASAFVLMSHCSNYSKLISDFYWIGRGKKGSKMTWNDLKLLEICRRLWNSNLF